LELSVQIWGIDHNARPFAELVRATSVSDNGAVLLDVALQTASRRSPRRETRSRHAQFRVV